MARTSVNEKSRLKSLTDRLDSLERFFRQLGREVPRRITPELVEDVLVRVASARAAIRAKHFEAALLYHELEDLHRLITEEVEITEALREAKRDARYLEGRWNAAHAPRPTVQGRQERFRREVHKVYPLNKPSGEDLLRLAEEMGIRIAGHVPNERTLRNWIRPAKRRN
jgi:hypothetical protein